MNYHDVEKLVERTRSAGDQEVSKVLELFADYLKHKNDATCAYERLKKVSEDMMLLCSERDLYSIATLLGYAQQSAETVAFICDVEGEARMEQGILIKDSRKMCDFNDKLKLAWNGR